MRYTNHCVRSLRAYGDSIQRQLKRTIARWNLPNLGHRLLGAMPSKPRKCANIPDQSLSGGVPTISERLLRHLEEYACVQLYASEYPFFADVHPACKQVAHDAARLSYELSLYPRLHDSPPLARAHAALRDHWRASWTIGGVSEGEYRTAIKCAALFLQRRSARVQQTAMELINEAVAQNGKKN
jgi:hypothetical protein